MITMIVTVTVTVIIIILITQVTVKMILAMTVMIVHFDSHSVLHQFMISFFQFCFT